jgi:AsmA protein
MSQDIVAPAPRRKKRILGRLGLAALVLVFAIAALAPVLSANRFRTRIQRALETALNRKVSIGSVHYTILRGPGFSVEDVLIDEAPEYGIEPFAHVESLEAHVRVLSMLSGRLAFSKLVLNEPSLNLVKNGAGPWNIQPLLGRAAAPGPHGVLPEIEISSGRLNFKFGSTKSVFYINDADVEVYPNEQGDLIFRLEGEPARTDHTAQGLGRLVARGSLHSKRGSEDELSMALQLERTAIPELMRLFDARDIGVRGFVASNIDFNGPLSHINITGDLRIDDIHRWDLMPNKGEGWALNYTGYLNLRAQQIRIETKAADAQATPVTGKFVASDYLSSPKWEASLSFRDLPASSLLETAQHMGAPLPPGATLDGKLNGEIGYSRPDGVKGNFVLSDAVLKFPQGGAMEFDSGRLAITNNEVTFGPAVIQLDNGQSAQIETKYVLDTQTSSLRIETAQMSIAEMKTVVARMLGVGSIPMLDICHQGAWKGWAAFERKGDETGVWTGEYEVQNTHLDIPGLSSAVRLASAAVQLEPTQVDVNRMKGHAGAVAFEGDFRFSLLADRPCRLRLSLGELQLSDLEHTLMPALRRQEGFLARALRFQRPKAPEWLAHRQIEGTFQVKQLLVDDLPLGSLRGRIAWNGVVAQLTNLESKLDTTEGAGKLVANLSGSLPQYRLTGSLHNLGYRNGTLDIEGTLETGGIGASLLLNAHSTGTFNGSEIELASDTQVDEVSGEYQFESGIAGPRLSLSKLQLTQGADVLHGQGVSQADGHVTLELTSGRKQVHLTGMLLPVHPVPAP